MSYHSDLIRKIDRMDWPDFSRNAFLSELHNVANEMYSRKTVEGYLASFLIFQQLSEEIVKLLIQNSSLLLQLSILPREIKERDVSGKTFGQLIGELEKGANDKDTKKLIKECQRLNGLRTNLVHRITLKTSVRSIQRQASGAKKIYDKIYDLFEQIRDQYRISFSKYADDVEEYKEVVHDYLKKPSKSRHCKKF
mgnify:FL=1